MQKKNLAIGAGVVIILVIIGVAFAFTHKAYAPAVGSTYASTSPVASPSTQATAVNNTIVLTKSNSSVGQYLTDSSGNTLYTYGADTKGVSNCTGSCLANWPAYQLASSNTNLPANFGSIKRPDNGQMQYTYKGMPLYTFTGDTMGQVTGNDVNNFKVAKP
jgi:predicted lipoprotein with Yx(FWY)xxD motif